MYIVLGCASFLSFLYTRSLVAVEPRRPPMTDVGTETAFRLDQRKHFRKSIHLLRSEVNGPYSPKGKKWRPRAPGGIMPR